MCGGGGTWNGCQITSGICVKEDGLTLISWTLHSALVFLKALGMLQIVYF